MKISSSMIGFNSQHEKQITDSAQQQSAAVSQQVTLSPDAASNWRAGTSVDLSYDARMRSEKAASVNSVSSVQSAQGIKQIQQTHNVSSLVETVLHEGMQLERLAMNPLIPVQNIQLASLETFQEIEAFSEQDIQALSEQDIQAMSAEELQARASFEQLDINISDITLNAGFRQMADEVRVEIANQRVYTEEEKLSVGTQGVITTEDGREINFLLELEMERSFVLEERFSEERVDRSLIDPLVINLHGGAAGLTNSSFSFDLNADGTEEEISFVAQGSGFLALDINNDGQINDGSELFGTQGQDGFSDLAKYDSDNNHWIDENDEIFNKLKVWTRDEEGNDQLTSLKDAGVGAIYLGSTSSSFDLTDDQNNLLGQVKRSGVFLFEDGTVSSIQELDIAVHEENAATAGGLAEQYQNAIDRFGQEQRFDNEQQVFEERPTFLDLLLAQDQAADELAERRGESETRQSVRAESTIEQRETSQSREVTQTDGETEQEEARVYVEHERLSVLQDLRERTEIQIADEQDKFEYLKAIIETLKQSTSEA
ncbi:hypothetical protein ACMXYV_10575 [Neptuniibacter sp. SY11_33]|uniref:hypothetical protein n=1 Tax=Neptuniibacter sp. SY11_33 TaxID=3398215 RepID=UPI0039F50BC5